MGTPRLATKAKTEPKAGRPKSEPRPPKSSLIEEMAKDPFVTPEEMAETFRVDPKTVSRWCRIGKFGRAPGVIQLPGKAGKYRVRTSTFKRALEAASGK